MSEQDPIYERWEVWINGRLVKAFPASEPTLQDITNLVKQHGTCETNKYEIIVREKSLSYFWRLSLR